MQDLKIRIDLDANGKTRSRLVVGDLKDVIFENDGPDELTVDIFKSVNGVPVGASIQQLKISKGGGPKKFKSKKTNHGTELKYVATIKNKTPEDPIIIIE